MSPEEIAQRRADMEALNEKRARLFEEAIAARSSGNTELFDAKWLEMRRLDPPYCEHDRSWASTCYLCEQIHMECFPEHYGQCSECKDFFDKDELVINKCDECRYSESE